MAGERIMLEGLANTRDLGGYSTTDHKTIKTKRIIRSGALFTATEEDLRILKEQFELNKIVDFRTETEKKQKPDPKVEKIEYISNPILQEAHMGITHEREQKPADLVEMMIMMCTEIGDKAGSYLADLYPVLVTHPEAIAGYRRFFELLLQNESGAVLYHCSEGKDRVGTGTALFLSALGVDRKTIMEDYLLTNQYGEAKRQNILQMIRERMPEDHIIRERFVLLNSVQEAYLASIFHTIESQFDSMDSFLQKQMGLTDTKRAKLQEMYLQ